MAKNNQKPPEKQTEPAKEPALTTQQSSFIPDAVPMLTDQRGDPEPSAAPATLAQRVERADAGVKSGLITTAEGYMAVLDGIPVAESKRGPTAEAATESMLGELLLQLAPYQDDGETAPVALCRLLQSLEVLEYDRLDIGDINNVLTFDAGMPPTGGRSEGARVRALVEKVKTLEAQLQPAHNALGKHANARGVILSHVKGSGPSYDVGGKYRLAMVTVKDGQVDLAEAADVVAGQASHELPFGLVRDHLEKRLEDYLTPEAHRS